MIVSSSPRLAFLAPRLRQVVLALAALFISHDAIYVAQFGVGDGYSRAMAAQGHDIYWVPGSILLTMALAVVVIGAFAALIRLRDRVARVGTIPVAGPSYVGEIANIWVRLFPSVALLFLIQENIEHLAVEGHLEGIGTLVGGDSAVVLPVLAATTLVLAAIGAVVRWRIRALEARLAAVRQRFSVAAPVTPPSGWDVVAAIVAHRWIMDRRDAGRAPPIDFHTDRITAA